MSMGMAVLVWSALWAAAFAADSCLHKQGMVRVDVSKRGILANHSMSCDADVKNFPNTLLGYLTPWNPEGKERALRYAAKFDIIAPVWYELTLVNDQFFITGDGVFDRDFIERLRKKNKNIKIMPRVLVKDNAVFKVSYNSAGDQIQEIAKLIVDYAKRFKYDGLVLEVGQYLTYVTLKESLAALIKATGEMLHDNEMQLIITVFLNRDLRNPIKSVEDYDDLAPFVDYFNIMSYDFGSGSHAPKQWAESVLSAFATTTIPPDKLLVGVPFYGILFGDEDRHARPIMSRDFLTYLRNSTTKTSWDRSEEEHAVSFTEYAGKEEKTSRIVFPSLYFFDRRLKMCQKKGCGIAIWEIGQGFEYFFPLF